MLVSKLSSSTVFEQRRQDGCCGFSRMLARDVPAAVGGVTVIREFMKANVTNVKKKRWGDILWFTIT